MLFGQFAAIRRVLGAALLIGVSAPLFGCSDEVFLKAESESGLSAEVVYRRTLPLFLYDADLVVLNADGDEVLRLQLLVARDDVGDLEAEIKGLDWRDGEVILDLEPNHYAGPRGVVIQ